MSLKPPKKSDMGKSWMKGRQDRVKRIQPEYHLIVTEGTKTEPAYFEAIKNEINRRHPQKSNCKLKGRVLIPFHCLRKQRPLLQYRQTCISMYGLYMTRMISLWNTSIKCRICAKSIPTRKQNIMRFGPISVLSYGFFCIFATFNLMFREMNISRS